MEKNSEKGAMDAVKRLNENFLSCSICTERFTDPSTLGCGHTFCRACLVRYTKTTPDAITAKSILCATCRQMTKVPDPSQPVEEWPKQLKSSFVIQGLLDEFKTSDDHTRDGAVADGAVADGAVADGAVAEGAVADGAVAAGRLCKEHNNDIEFCCRKCDMAVCSKCGIIYHGKCDSIVLIDSMVIEMKSTLKETESKIITSITDLQTNLTLHKSMIEMVEKNKASEQREIRRLREEVMELVKQKEKKLVDTLDELTEKQKRHLRQQIKSEEIDLENYQHSLDQMTLSSESPIDLYDTYRKSQSDTIKWAVEKSVVDKSEFQTVQLVDKQDVHEFGRKFHLGRLAMKLAPTAADLTKTPRLHQKINMRKTGDEETPFPRDMIVIDAMGEEIVVVINFNDHSMRSFPVKGTPTCRKTLTLQQEPNTVSNLTRKKIVVSSSSYFSIILIPELVVHSTILTQKDYKCLAVLNQKELVAGCWAPACVDIIDLSGKVLGSLTNGNDHKTLTQRPFYLCVTEKGHILVSDDGSKTVYSMTQEGEIVFAYRPKGQQALETPRGITATPSGDILFADSGSGKVIQLTDGGEFVRDVLTRQDGLERPCGICLHHNRLYVSEYFDGTMKEYHF